MTDLSKMYATLANETPNLYPQSFAPLDKDVFKLAALYAPLARQLSTEEMQAMHATALGDNFSVFPESVELHSEVNGQNFITSIVHANLISKPFDEKAVRASMKVISANVFMDEENSIWKVAKIGDQSRLVQSKREDFGAILKERINSQRNVLVASVCTTDDISVHDTENGDYVLYYSPASRDLGVGFAFKIRDKYSIFSYVNKEYEDVFTHNIVRAASIDPKMKASPFHASTLNDDLEMTGGEFTKALSSKFRDYFKFLYDGTDYFKKLEDMLKLRDQNGMEHLPVNLMR